jgi:hypothetical protein
LIPDRLADHLHDGVSCPEALEKISARAGISLEEVVEKPSGVWCSDEK